MSEEMELALTRPLREGITNHCKLTGGDSPTTSSTVCHRYHVTNVT